MLKNISNLALIGILVVLSLVYLGVDYFKKQSRTGSFPEKLVKFDPEKITGLEIFSPDDSVFLIKDNTDWKLKLKSGKTVDAENETVNRVVETLLTIKPNRLATKDESKWKEFQVDATGTRVKVYEKGKAATDLIVGRFGMNQNPRQQQPSYGMGGMGQFYSYVRLADQPDVYVANDIMSYSLPANPSSYRFDRVIQLSTDSLIEISFQYPADSSFKMTKSNGKWIIDGKTADSTAIASYLSDIRSYRHEQFADEEEASGAPQLKAEFKLNGSENIVVEAYQLPDKWIIKSSQNESLLLDTDNTVVHNIFTGRNKLLKTR